MEQAAGPAPEPNKPQPFTIIHGFDLHLSLMDRIRHLFNRKVSIYCYIEVDKPTKPVDSKTVVYTEYFFKKKTKTPPKDEKPQN